MQRVTFLTHICEILGEESIVRSTGLDNAKSFSANRCNGSSPLKLLIT